MRAVLLALVLAVPGGDREEGVRLYEQGRYAEAAAAFRRALEAEGPDAELSYNLALSLWRAGERDAAQTAVEEMATVAGDEHDGRRYGLLGALRYDDAQALREQAHAVQDPAAGTQKLELLGQALQKAQNARNHFARAGAAPDATPAIARNLERALRLIEELEKEIEEARQEQQQQQQDQQQQDQQQQDQQDDQQQQQQQQQQQDQPQEQKQEQKQEQEQQQKEEPQQDEQQQDSEQQDQQQRQDAPGEQTEARNLSPEEKQRMLDQLQELEQLLQKIRAQQAARRIRVEKDW